MQKLGSLFVFFIIFIFTSARSYGQNLANEVCSQPLKPLQNMLQNHPSDEFIPPVISRNRKANVHPHELKEAGKFVENEEDLSSLSDGEYVYLIDDKMRVIYSSKTPEVNVDPEGNHLATHRSLAAKYKRLTKKVPVIIAAGEIIKTHGKTSEVNNGAWTYPGKKIHLKFAVHRLKKAGLPMEQNTLEKDFSIEPTGKIRLKHAKDELRSKYFIYYRDVDEYKRLQEFYKNLSEIYPDPKSAGRMDLDQVEKIASTEVQRVIQQSKSLSSEEEKKLLTKASWMNYAIKTIQIDGIATLVQRFRVKSAEPGFPGFEKVMETLQRVFLDHHLKTNPI